MGLFDVFRRPTFVVEGIGSLERRRGAWLGTIPFDGLRVPLELAGPRSEVPASRLDLARELVQRYRTLTPTIQEALYEYYQPYLEGAEDETVPKIASASEIWDYVRIEHVRIGPVGGIETVEIGYSTTWDVEHTPAARFQGWRLVEFNGSVQSVY